MEEYLLINIAYAEDHKIVRKGVIEILKDFGCFNVVIEACDGKDLISQLEKTNQSIDIILLDINMPELDGFDVMELIKKDWSDIKVLALTMHTDEFYIIRMIKYGVNGYLFKNVDPKELKQALVTIYKTGYYYSDIATNRFFHKVRNELLKLPHFTEHEIDFLKYCPTDLNYGQIAGKLNLSTKAIEGYRDRLFEKLSVNSRIGLAMFAVEYGFYKIESKLKPATKLFIR